MRNPNAAAIASLPLPSEGSIVQPKPTASPAQAFARNKLLPYVADLELEVDRLRKQCQFLRQRAGDMIRTILRPTGEAAANGDTAGRLQEAIEAARLLAGVLQDLAEPSGYHPVHDQVIAVAVRPIIEQIFRQQQCLAEAQAELRLDLRCDYVEWFPARLRHILENLIANSLRYADPSKSECWVQVSLDTLQQGYEFRVADNGVGIEAHLQDEIFELFHRAGPARPTGLGVGLPVVKLLVEQSGGKLTVDSGEGQGATFVVFLPRFDIADYLE